MAPLRSAAGSTLERPGLQAALQMLKHGRANTLLVAKLDRLSRSLRDVCALVEGNRAQRTPLCEPFP